MAEIVPFSLSFRWIFLAFLLDFYSIFYEVACAGFLLNPIRITQTTSEKNTNNTTTGTKKHTPHDKKLKPKSGELDDTRRRTHTAKPKRTNTQEIWENLNQNHGHASPHHTTTIRRKKYTTPQP